MQEKHKGTQKLINYEIRDEIIALQPYTLPCPSLSHTFKKQNSIAMHNTLGIPAHVQNQWVATCVVGSGVI